MNHIGLEEQNSNQAFVTLGKYLEEDGWYPHQIEERTIYRVGFEGKNGRYTCYAQIRMDLEQFIFYAMASIKVPETLYLPIAEFITRANYGLRIGNFELDFSDGDLRYKSSLDFEGALLTPALIKNAIYPAVQTLDRYMPGLMAVIYGGQTPADAIRAIEGGLD